MGAPENEISRKKWQNDRSGRKKHEKSKKLEGGTRLNKIAWESDEAKERGWGVEVFEKLEVEGSLS